MFHSSSSFYLTVLYEQQWVKERGVSFREVARSSDIDPSIVNKLVNSRREKVYLAHIERIAEALDISDISEIIYLR